MRNYTGIICGNSDILLQQMLTDGVRVDLVLTDPPYNLNKDFGNNSDKLPLEVFFGNIKEAHRTMPRFTCSKWKHNMVWHSSLHWIYSIYNV